MKNLRQACAKSVWGLFLHSECQAITPPSIRCNTLYREHGNLGPLTVLPWEVRSLSEQAGEVINQNVQRATVRYGSMLLWDKLCQHACRGKRWRRRLFLGCTTVHHTSIHDTRTSTMFAPESQVPKRSALHSTRMTWTPSMATLD